MNAEPTKTDMNAAGDTGQIFGGQAVAVFADRSHASRNDVAVDVWYRQST